ncbi:MAG: PQQ-binding-like beta-propeller repeat protein [Phycisphaeraceae bacterium]
MSHPQYPLIMRAVRRFASLACLLLPLTLPSIAHAETPERPSTGSAIAQGTGYPVTWSTEQHVTWRVRLSGHAHSSPAVTDDAVIVTALSSDRAEYAILCLARSDGSLRWRYTPPAPTTDTDQARDGFPAPTTTPTVQGDTVYVTLPSVGIVALALETGELRWHRSNQPAEQNAAPPALGTPLIVDDLLIIPHGQTSLIALHKQTGQTVWRTTAPHHPPTPPLPADADTEQVGGPGKAVLRRSATGDEIIVAMPYQVASFNPTTGRAYWYCTGLGPAVATAPMIQGDRLVAASRDGSVLAMQLPTTQSGNVTDTARLWHRPSSDTPYGPAGLIAGEHLYLPDADGNLACIVVDTGEVVWRRKMTSRIASSLLAAEGRLYLTDHDGVTHVLRAAPQFDQLRTNTLIEGDTVTATPTFDRSQIFLRTRTHLYGLGVKSTP